MAFSIYLHPRGMSAYHLNKPANLNTTQPQLDALSLTVPPLLYFSLFPPTSILNSKAGEERSEVFFTFLRMK